jgi:hypothetical protein
MSSVRLGWRLGRFREVERAWTMTARPMLEEKLAVESCEAVGEVERGCWALDGGLTNDPEDEEIGSAIQGSIEQSRKRLSGRGRFR